MVVVVGDGGVAVVTAGTFVDIVSTFHCCDCCSRSLIRAASSRLPFSIRSSNDNSYSFDAKGGTSFTAADESMDKGDATGFIAMFISAVKATDDDEIDKIV